ncbi:MAG: Prokaryotic membrane lipoprotein lipid attachment site [Phormidesmis priestleyi Ana]|uniref:Prokaryotic membrane lipoprotein lipid attachment site n=1 Tax=Phormidesmis priestleyi Ana TaxID=1666911 RepID=A0A0P8BV43_9CYAN|nr:MAG: Prokaryotic membrane lipoprotein lipid attachment site [Phormidesmis priestleyi Ana]
MKTALRRISKIKKISSKKISSAVAFSFMAIALAACDPQSGVRLDSVETEVPVPEEQAEVPVESEVGGNEVSNNVDINTLIGETVTVSTKVTETISPNLFTVYDIESLQGQELLAVTDLPIPEMGTNIEVTGDILEMDEAAIQEAYNVVLEPEVVEAYAGKPYLAVKAIEAVD